METFDPDNSKYKKVEDLPVEEQAKYTNVPGGGFVTNEAAATYEAAQAEAARMNKLRTIKERLFGVNKTNATDIMRNEANLEDYARTPEGIILKDVSDFIKMNSNSRHMPGNINDRIKEIGMSEREGKFLLGLKQSSDAHDQLLYKITLAHRAGLRDQEIRNVLNEMHAGSDELYIAPSELRDLFDELEKRRAESKGQTYVTIKERAQVEEAAQNLEKENTVSDFMNSISPRLLELSELNDNPDLREQILAIVREEYSKKV
jgi:Asp-tRNA(Asn)/Glu-tRNA(Gln) amidotransferase B subunit